MGIYGRHIVPRLIDLSMRQKALRPYRERIVGGAQGRVLEIGAGSGENLPLYGSSTRSVVAVEPSPELLRRAGRRAEAAAAYDRALALCTNAVERRYLERRRAEVR